MKKREEMSYFHVIRVLVPDLLKSAPLWMAADCLGMLISSTCFAFATVMMQMLFDAVTNAAAARAITNALILTVAAAAGIQILNQLLNGICNFIASPTGRKITGVLHKEIHAKIAMLPALDFEDAEKLDCITKAEQGADSAKQFYHSISTILTFYLPYFIVLGIYLHSLRPLLLWSVVLIFAPIVISQIVRGAVFKKLVDEAAPLSRKLVYYEGEMFHRDYAKETRILGIFSYINKLHAQTLALFCSKKWKTARKAQFIELGLRLLTLAGYFGVLYLLFDSLMKSYITVGGFAAVFASLGTMFFFMDDAVGGYFGSMLEHSAALKNYIRFIELPEDNGKEVDMKLKTEISIENVSFVYPNTSSPALDNVSLTIHAGETIAFVGENGAGKTTLVRILTGILKPSSGTVKYDDYDTAQLSKKSLFAVSSGVFQKFQKYQMTLSDNISIADTSSAPDITKIDSVIEKSDIDVGDNFPEGIDTMLSREFDGIDLSGGQWQRVALARGLYKECSLIVLDEPTSAIDPIEETKLYRKFKEISVGKTAIIVTHRLASTKIADRIVVMKNGTIDEIGTHEELMNAGGHYAVMYNSQAKWYA